MPIVLWWSALPKTGWQGYHHEVTITHALHTAISHSQLAGIRDIGSNALKCPVAADSSGGCQSYHRAFFSDPPEIPGDIRCPHLHGSLDASCVPGGGIIAIGCRAESVGQSSALRCRQDWGATGASAYRAGDLLGVAAFVGRASRRVDLGWRW